jgi:hypothetical protein
LLNWTIFNGILRAMCPAHEQSAAQNMREVPQN